VNARRLAGRLLVASIAVAIVGAVAMWALLTEPWPISRRHGPDTPFAKQMFRYVVNRDVPAGAHEVFAREEWGFGGDSIYSLRLEIDTPGVAEEIARELDLSMVPPAQVARLRYFRGPSWWPTAVEVQRIARAYARTDVVLWVDVERRRAFLQKAGFAPAWPSP
jgi:hypothetical protein